MQHFKKLIFIMLITINNIKAAEDGIMPVPGGAEIIRDQRQIIIQEINDILQAAKLEELKKIYNVILDEEIKKIQEHKNLSQNSIDQVNHKIRQSVYLGHYDFNPQLSIFDNERKNRYDKQVRDCQAQIDHINSLKLK